MLNGVPLMIDLTDVFGFRTAAMHARISKNGRNASAWNHAHPSHKFPCGKARPRWTSSSRRSAQATVKFSDEIGARARYSPD